MDAKSEGSSHTNAHGSVQTMAHSGSNKSKRSSVSFVPPTVNHATYAQAQPAPSSKKIPRQEILNGPRSVWSASPTVSPPYPPRATEDRASKWHTQGTSSILSAGWKNQKKGESRSRPMGQLTSDESRVMLLEENRILQEQLQAANDRVRELELHNQTLKQRSEKLQISLNEKDITLEYQKADLIIASAVRDLLGDIKTWANKACTSSKPITINHIGTDDPIQELVFRVAPGLRDIDCISKYVAERKRRRMFVRGLISTMIIDSMVRNVPVPGVSAISTCRDQWLRPDVKDAVSILEYNLLYSGPKMNLKTFHEWRVLTVTLLGKVFGESSDTWEECVGSYLQDQAGGIMNLVRPWTDAKEENVLVKDMVEILKCALLLSSQLRHQKASWALRFPQSMSRSLSHSGPVTLDPRQMKDLNGPDDEDEDKDDKLDARCHKLVDIFVTPGLYKQGNMDGEKYETDYVVLKAEVTCAEVPPLPSRDVVHQAGDP